MGPMTPEEKQAAKRETARRWRRNHPEVLRAKKRRYRVRHKEQEAERQRRYRASHPRTPTTKRRSPEEKLLEGARYRARRTGRDFDLKIADIVIPARCPIFDVPMIGPDAPSLDRVDNDQGYIRGNVCVISKRANRLKREITLIGLDRLREYMLTYKTKS